jgi:hypothetical protein
MTHPRLAAPRLLLALVGLCLAPAVTAQVPEGYIIGCSAMDATSEPGGVFWLHPSVPGNPITSVVGLGTDLTGSGSPSSLTGASSVAYRVADGALVVGEIGPLGTSIDLHVIRLSGNTVVSDTTYLLGTSSGPGGGTTGGHVSQIEILPDGRILVGVSNLQSPGPLAGQLLGIVDPITGSVTPVPLSTIPRGALNGMVYDAATSTIYFQMTTAPCINCKTTVFQVSLAGSDETTITTINGIGSSLVLDPSGQLIVAGRDGTSGMLYTLDPATGTKTQIIHPLGDISAHMMDLPGGDLVVATGLASIDPDTIWRMSTDGLITTKYTNLLPGELGIKTGVAINPDPKPYGFATPGVGNYYWDLLDNGTPFFGNNNFNLQLATDQPALPPGYYAISRGQASFLAEGVVLFLDPSPGGLLPPQATPADGRIPLPIPPDPILVGTTLYAQAVFIESVVPLALASTDGLAITIL